MGSADQEPQRLLCWTVYAYRKPGMDEEEYHRYLSEVHAPLVKNLLVKYGMVQWSMTHNTSSTRPLMAEIGGPQFNSIADYDCIVTAVFPNVQNVVRMKADPIFKERLMPDHENFADTKRSRMSVGWIENHIMDGKAVD